MMIWIEQNIGTIVVCALLIAMVAAILLGMRRDKKRGKSSCGGTCAHCAMNGACHSKK